MLTEPTRVALIGFGKVAREQHLPTIVANHCFELVAVADPIGMCPDLPHYPNLQAMLAAGHHIDAVSICTPPAMRSAIAHEALAAGCHVLLEKPPAAVPSQLSALADVANQKGLGFYASWHSRETSCVDIAQRWLAGKQVERVDVIWREDIRKWHPGQDWLLARGGLGVFDPGINAIAILTHILPCRIWAEAAEMIVPTNRGAPIAATAELGSAQGGKVVLDFNFMHDGPEQWDIRIEAGGQLLELQNCGRQLLIDGVEQAEAQEEKYARIYRRFFELAEKGLIDADGLPLALVTDIMTVAKVTPGASFEF